MSVAPHSSDWHLISRPVYPGRCSHCQALILVAMDGGMTICADPSPLGIPAELGEILSGRGTYEIEQVPGVRKSYLHYRDHMRIRAARGWPVVKRHRCPDGALRTTSWRPPPDKKPAGNPRPKYTPANSPVPF